MGIQNPIKPIVDKYARSGIIKLITITNVHQWILTKSFNLAAGVTEYSNILKVDCDSLLSSDFFSYHNLDKERVFFAGDWKKARDENEKHTNGIIFMKRDDFFKVGGYNEFITTYGYDDCDLYERMESRAKRLFVNIDTVKHIEHSNCIRIENQTIGYRNRVDVEIEFNRLIAGLNIWNGTFSHFNIKKIFDNQYTGEYSHGVELNDRIREKLLIKAYKNRENV